MWGVYPGSDGFATREARLYLYLGKLFDVIRTYNSFSLKNIYINYIFSIVPNIPTHSEKSFDDFKTSFGNKTTFDFEEFFRKITAVKLDSGKYCVKPKTAGSIYQFKVWDFANRSEKNRGSKIDRIKVSLRYATIYQYLLHGNQLSTFSGEDLNSEVEIFGSSLNARLKYFGCMFPELEKPFGAIGTYEDILLGILSEKFKFHELLISPPSSSFLHWRSAELLEQIFEKFRSKKKPLRVIFSISKTKAEIMKNLNQYVKKIVEVNHAYDVRDGTKKKLSGAWVKYYLEI